MRIIFLFLLLGANVILVGQKATFRAQVDAKEILLGSYIEVQFILENADGRNFSPPSFKQFDILSGPNRSSSMSIVNGAVSKSLSYSYSLRPKSIGQFTIGKASIESSEGKLFSNELSFSVIKGSEIKTEEDEDVFIQTICTDTTSYVGQQVTIWYKLFTRVDVRSVNFISEPDFDGFYTENLSTNNEPTKREIINGQEYATKIVRKYSLFPQQKGVYTIDPLAVNLGIATKNSQRSFLFSSQLQQKRIMTNPIQLIVLNTPDTDDISYSGAVGEYEIEAGIAKRSITTDDAIKLNLRIIGNGDNKTVGPPQWIASDSLIVYDPNLIEDQVFAKSDGLYHRKTYEYLIVPKYPGKYSIDPEFTFFSPDSSKYITITKRLPDINIVVGSNYSNNSLELEDKEKPIIFTKAHFIGIKEKIHGKSWHILFLMAIPISLISMGMVYFIKNKKGDYDPELIKKEKALGNAKKRLSILEDLLHENNNQKFYEELSRVVKQFIEDKYSIPSLHVSNSQSLSGLINAGLDKAIIKSFEDILNTSEIGLYAPGLQSDKQEIFQKTLQLFAALDN